MNNDSLTPIFPEIEITRIEAKFKLGQNRSTDDQAKMIDALETSGSAESARLAALMRSEQQTVA